MLRCMEVTAGTVPCTDAARRRMRQQLLALETYHGLPSVFFTLNPADTRHPWTCFFSTAPAEPWQPVASDEALAETLRRVNLLHRVATDPVAVARAFHEHVQCFFKFLLGCGDGSASPDGPITAEGHGVLGPVLAYYGVTEPQMRGSLHIHVLLHLYSFTTPAAFVELARAGLQGLQERLRTWVESCLYTSLEAVARQLPSPDEGRDYLRSLQPFPHTEKQRVLLRARVDAPSLSPDWPDCSTWFAGCREESLPASPPWADPREDALRGLPHFLPWPRSRPEHLRQESYKVLLYDVRHTALHCCLHDCTSRTCHKGFLGRIGFCCLGFWNWGRVTDASGETRWQRLHGHALQPRGTIGIWPPQKNVILTERHHAFHTRFNLAVLLAAKCNHDISILVRAPDAAALVDSASFASCMASSVQLASFYATAYMSKVQPHISNLFDVLAAGQRRLEEHMATGRSAGAPELPGTARMRKTLTRMLTSAQRRSHKSMPEMVHYLLGYPEAYCSHAFRALYVRDLLEQALAKRSAESEEHFLVAAGANPSAPTHAFPQARAAVPANLQATDYMHRGVPLAQWPLYFYVAGVSRSKKPRGSTGLPPAFVPFAPGHPDGCANLQRVLLLERWYVPQLTGAHLPPVAVDPEGRAERRSGCRR